MTHTPGPWLCDDIQVTANVKNHPLRNPQLICICESMYSADGITQQYGSEESNAALIAAAPDLLEACKMALGAFENNNCIDWSILEKAIAKAEGKS